MQAPRLLILASTLAMLVASPMVLAGDDMPNAQEPAVDGLDLQPWAGRWFGRGDDLAVALVVDPDQSDCMLMIVHLRDGKPYATTAGRPHCQLHPHGALQLELGERQLQLQWHDGNLQLQDSVQRGGISLRLRPLDQPAAPLL